MSRGQSSRRHPNYSRSGPVYCRRDKERNVARFARCCRASPGGRATIDFSTVGLRFSPRRPYISALDFQAFRAADCNLKVTLPNKLNTNFALSTWDCKPMLDRHSLVRDRPHTASEAMVYVLGKIFSRAKTSTQRNLSVNCRPFSQLFPLMTEQFRLTAVYPFCREVNQSRPSHHTQSLPSFWRPLIYGDNRERASRHFLSGERSSRSSGRLRLPHSPPVG